MRDITVEQRSTISFRITATILRIGYPTFCVLIGNVHLTVVDVGLYNILWVIENGNSSPCPCSVHFLFASPLTVTLMKVYFLLNIKGKKYETFVWSDRLKKVNLKLSSPRLSSFHCEMDEKVETGNVSNAIKVYNSSHQCMVDFVKSI